MKRGLEPVNLLPSSVTTDGGAPRVCTGGVTRAEGSKFTGFNSRLIETYSIEAYSNEKSNSSKVSSNAGIKFSIKYSTSGRPI